MLRQSNLLINTFYRLFYLFRIKDDNMHYKKYLKVYSLKIKIGEIKLKPSKSSLRHVF